MFPLLRFRRFLTIFTTELMNLTFILVVNGKRTLTLRIILALDFYFIFSMSIGDRYRNRLYRVISVQHTIYTKHRCPVWLSVVIIIIIMFIGTTSSQCVNIQYLLVTSRSIFSRCACLPAGAQQTRKNNNRSYSSIYVLLCFFFLFS